MTTKPSISELTSLEQAMTPTGWVVYRACDEYPGHCPPPERSCGIVNPHLPYTRSCPVAIFESDSREECSHPIKTVDAAGICAMRNNYSKLLDLARAAIQLGNAQTEAAKVRARWRTTVTPDGPITPIVEEALAAIGAADKAISIAREAYNTALSQVRP